LPAKASANEKVPARIFSLRILTPNICKKKSRMLHRIQSTKSERARCESM